MEPFTVSIEQSQFGVIFLVISQVGLGEKVKPYQSHMQKNASRTAGPFVRMCLTTMGCPIFLMEPKGSPADSDPPQNQTQRIPKPEDHPLADFATKQSGSAHTHQNNVSAVGIGRKS